MPDITAKIRAKGLESTGVTEALAEKMWNNVGGHYMAVVEVRVEEPHGPTADGKRRVDTVVSIFEPATSPRIEEHLREMARGMHAARMTNEGQPVLPGTAGAGARSLDDVMGEGQALLTKDDDGTATGVWNGDMDAPTGATESAVPTSCAFPGCTLTDGHDGAHDPFGAPASSDAPEPDGGSVTELPKRSKRAK